MKVILDLCVIPWVSASRCPITQATCERVIRATGLNANMHYGTNIENEWDDVMAAVKCCHEVVHYMGVTTTKLGTRTNRAQTMEDKVRSVEDKLTPDK